MLFDWFTLLAQLVNFLVLVWLLKRYLYKPILNAIDEREKLIARQLEEAEASKANARQEFETYQQKNAAFDQQHQERLQSAISEVNAERQKLLEQTRREVESLRLQLQESLQAEQQNLGAEIKRRTRAEVFAITRKTLADLAAVNLEEQMSRVFVNRINALTSGEKESLISALTHSSGKLSVRSTFELPEAQQLAIQSAVKNNFSTVIQLDFETAPHLVSGIELLSDGYKISWTIEDYIVSLENHISELLNENVYTTA